MADQGTGVVQVVRLTESEAHELVPGVTMRPLFGQGAMLNLIEFSPGTSVPLHAHPHEQLGHVLEGEVLMTIGGIDYPLGPGDAYQIPGGVEHGAVCEERCLVMDIFAPVREDYRARAGA
ncbi:MAG: cupin domain-containing protein [Thermoleophilia bacterium]|nr:cupin domain-containing protein [Thermoleophilia bacterium]